MTANTFTWGPVDNRCCTPTQKPACSSWALTTLPAPSLQMNNTLNLSCDRSRPTFQMFPSILAEPLTHKHPMPVCICLSEISRETMSSHTAALSRHALHLVEALISMRLALQHRSCCCCCGNAPPFPTPPHSQLIQGEHQRKHTLHATAHKLTVDASLCKWESASRGESVSIVCVCQKHTPRAAPSCGTCEVP